uniref:Uncharacterized protein n=1 Tax=Tanacetum cinerariifolium TaxID=118510 RepID=A0A6L2L799_TANCI|nr:hypothetical protein [Tanacetum cinerariifolium]
MLRDNVLVELRKKFEKVKQERDELKLKLKNFQTSSKNVSKLLANQITNRTGLGYDNQAFNSNVFDCDELISFESDVSMPTSPVYDMYQSGEGPSAPIIEDLVSDSEDESVGEPMPTQKAPSFVQTFEYVKTPRPPVKPVKHPIPAENLRKDIPKSKCHRHSLNRKVCFVCKSLTHLIKDCDYYEQKMVQKPVRNHAMRANPQHSARMNHTPPNRHVVPTTVLTRSRIVPLNAARPVSIVVPKTNVKPHRPANHVVNMAHSLIRRPFNLRPSPKQSNFHQKVTTVKTNQVNAIEGVKGNWGNPQHALKYKGVIDSSCSRHMTGNISYLSDFEEVNGRHVAFGGNPKGGKITRKGKIRTGKLDFDDVYFVKELKFNLFSISQMCDKKNNVLFIDTKCIVLSSDFKLPNDNHNGIAERKKRTLIEAARTMLADSLLPILFWVEVVNNACYVQNRVLVTKPHNKTPYELLLGRKPTIGLMRPFGCPVTILNTLDPLGKFNGKADEGFLAGYSVSSKAFRVFNSRTRIVQETLHINFLENQPNVVGSGPTWLFDIDTLTQSMNYQPVVTGNQPNSSAGIQEHFDAVKEPESKAHVSSSSSAKKKKPDDKTKRKAKGKRVNAASTPVTAVELNSTNNTNTFSAAGPSNNVVSLNFKLGGQSLFMDPSQYPNDPDMPALEDITYSDDEEDVGAEADFYNLETNITVSPIPTSRVYKDHIVTQIISDLSSSPQTRSMTRIVKDQGGLTQINNEDFHTCIFACFLSQEEPKRVHQVLKDPSWIEAMQEELLQFKMQKGHTQEEGIDYEEVFAPVARIEAIRLFLAYASFMGFMVYKVVKPLYGLHQAPRAWYETLANYLLENAIQRGKINQTFFIKRQKRDILLVQVYVDDIIFGPTNKEPCKAFEKLMKDKFQISSMDGKSASMPIDTEKLLLKDPDGEDVDVHTYRSMIGSLMYLTSSRPDIMFVVCACARFQVTPKASHLHVVKRIFWYLKGKPHLSLWYPKDSPFNLVVYSNNDYAGASLDRKSTTGGYQFLGYRLISWQCKKQTVVGTLSTEVEYVAATSCCAQVLWIQNQLLDYGLTMQVTQSSMKLLEWTLHVTNVSSAD